MVLIWRGLERRQVVEGWRGGGGWRIVQRRKMHNRKKICL
jgi:hypothetical protein